MVEENLPKAVMTGWVVERMPGGESLIPKGDGFSMREVSGFGATGI